MLKYEPPLRDIEFVLHEWIDAAHDWTATRPWRELDGLTVNAILDEAARFAVEELLPVNAASDVEGCVFSNGAVRTPEGFRAAYQRFVTAGWPKLSCAPEHGGQGMPGLLSAALYEMLNAGSHAWTMYPGLAHGAYQCLSTHGARELQSEFLPRIVSGEWLATMCLTEPQAGTDLGLVRTSAKPVEGTQGNAPTHRVTGRKMFISGGAHDLTDNIVHLVLARLPQSPQGSKGLSLFLVPQRIQRAGVVVENAVRCEGIEHKMGIRGSATCSLSFDDAHAWLIGTAHQGLAAMFVMMNAARLQVGLQGLGLAELAYQNARQYASERRQMRAPTRHPSATDPADPIASHPAIRNMLSRIRSVIEGERALAYWIAHLLDLAEAHEDGADRQNALRIASLLTPVIKSLFAENGFQIASDALQTFGGYGYIRDTGIEQILRDCRITMIYEGTNEVQAIDLINRKIIADKGSVLESLIIHMDLEVAASTKLFGGEPHTRALKRMNARLRSLSRKLIADSATDRELSFRIADDLLRVIGVVVIGYTWCKSMRIARGHPESESEFYLEKLSTGKDYFKLVWPSLAGYWLRIKANWTQPLPDR